VSGAARVKEANLAPCLVLAGVWHSVLRCRDGDGDEMEMWTEYGDGDGAGSEQVCR